MSIDYNEIISPVLKKVFFRIVFALVAYYDLNLHQIDVKIAFLNGDLKEEIYMDQPEGFVINVRENLVYKLNTSMYGLKQAFDNDILSSTISLGHMILWEILLINIST